MGMFDGMIKIKHCLREYLFICFLNENILCVLDTIIKYLLNFIVNVND